MSGQEIALENTNIVNNSLENGLKETEISQVTLIDWILKLSKLKHIEKMAFFFKQVNNNNHLQHPLNQLYERLVIAASLGEDEPRQRVWIELVNYETYKQRQLEEKELAIGELKRSLCDLTEKRFRTSLNDSGSGPDAPPLANLEFLLNEKEAHVRELLHDLEDKSTEIQKLKQTIKDQDLVILSHNTNINVNN